MLWNALADYPAAQTVEALAHFFRESVRLLDADGARWCLAVRLGADEIAHGDLCAGWRVREVLVHDATPEVQTRVRAFLDGVGKQDPARVGEPTVRVLQGSGEFRLLTLRESVADFEAFCRSEHHRLYYAPVGIADRLWVGCPVNADVESGFVFDRHQHTGKGLFGQADRERAEFLLRGINWFHRRLALSRRVRGGQSPCTPAERRTLSLLLTSQGEKEIADALGLSLSTVHSRITTIYRKFGVRGRADLMALWL